MTMHPHLLSTAALDPTWLAIVATIGAVGLIATAVTLVRQTTPPTRVDRERVARRREASSSIAH
ncbi:hypothetical protein [Agrococcus sp. Ld7]|uniref:hypothetical protein n=1 Tax=Agrococcus sp. Ld7 TaxID=649148 RepID=UPI003867CA41